MIAPGFDSNRQFPRPQTTVELDVRPNHGVVTESGLICADVSAAETPFCRTAPQTGFANDTTGSVVTWRQACGKLHGTMARSTEAFVSANLFDLGLGYVAVARFRGSGEVEVGAFLVDVYCQGVKNAFYTRTDQAEYDRSLLERIIAATNRKPLDPASARKLVEGAAAYAQNLGLAPHPDYKKACRVFGGINSADSAASFTFGRDGKPFYVQGRFDSFERCLKILHQLRACCGVDNFDFMAVGGATEIEELERNGFTIRQKVPAPPSEME